MHSFIWLVHGCLGFRDEDAEKLGKGEEDAAVAVPAEASQTMPQVPITTPPPPVTDMSGQAAYGGYSSWYQVGSHIYGIDQKCQQTFDFCVTSYSFFLSSSPSMATMATRTPGTTTRVITLPARGGNRDSDSSHRHRKPFNLIWTDASAEQQSQWSWHSNTFILLPLQSYLNVLHLCESDAYYLWSMWSMFMLKEKQDSRNIDAHTQKFSILFRNIFVFLCKLTPPETPSGLFPCSKHPSDIFYQSQIGCFCNVYKSVYSTSPCSRLCGVFVPVTEKNVWICGKDKLFFSTAPVDGENMRFEELLKET